MTTTETIKDPKDEKREQMLCFVRDVLNERASALRSAFEVNPFIFCESPEGKEQLKRVVAVEAAADVFTHLTGEWQKHVERRPEWLRTIVNQSMATFINGMK